MESISKPFAVLATSFRSSAVNTARIKLTIFYETVIFLILALFSIGVYGLFDKSIGEDLRYPQLGIGIQLLGHMKSDLAKDVLAEEKLRLRDILVTVDVVILVLAGGLSYVLAGYTLRPIKESYEKQKKFLADAAHEFRTPLAVMKIGMQLALKEKTSQEEYERLAKESVEEIDFLNAIVEDMLFLAKSDHLKKIAFRKLDFTLIIEKQIALMRPYAEQKSVHLESAPMEETMLWGNEAHLKRLVANVVKNAIDYNVSGGKVLISCEKNRHWAHLIISDTGVGISQENLENIFDRFYKADSSREKQSGGAGLGLSIVHEIVKSHRGYISAESVIGEGTKISISLPLLS